MEVRPTLSFLDQLQEATIGFSGYARLGRSKRSGFGYLALLLALVLVVNAYINMVQIRRVSTEVARQVTALADFHLKGGRLTYDGAMPVRVSTTGGFPVIIDTTGQTTPATIPDPIAILVAQEGYTLVQTGMAPVAMEYPPGEMTKADLLDLLTDSPERIVYLAYPFIYTFQLAAKALDALLLALIGLLYGRISKRQVPFGLSYKLALYAISLPTIIQWIWQDFHTYLPTGFVAWWLIAAIYQLFGLRAYFAAEGESHT